jgi:plasmid stability protein
MPSVLIRNLDEHTHRRLKARAAANRRSLEEEARELLRQGSFHPAPERENIADAALRLFGPEHGFDLDIPPRGSARGRKPIDFSGPEFDTNGPDVDTEAGTT